MRKAERVPTDPSPEEPLSEELEEEMRLERVRRSLDFHRFLVEETQRRDAQSKQAENNYYKRYDPEDFDGA